MDMPDYYDEMQADAVDDVDLDGIPEGCTPADARKLREANHALAIELHEYKEKTRERLHHAIATSFPFKEMKEDMIARDWAIKIINEVLGDE